MELITYLINYLPEYKVNTYTFNKVDNLDILITINTVTL